MQVEKSSFGFLDDGREVFLFSIRNSSGMELAVINYGAIIQKIVFPDRKGDLVDTVLGFDSIEEYIDDKAYIGVTIGRYANRIGNASFTLDGQQFVLSKNENENQLHGGKKGFHKSLWNAEIFQLETTAGILLKHQSPHLEDGYPGNLSVKVKISLSEEDIVQIEYEGESSHKTVLNLTHHDYFNLHKNKDESIRSHKLKLYVNAFTPLKEDQIPNGEIHDIEKLDPCFLQSHTIGTYIDTVDPIIGLDHNFVLCKKEKDLFHAADLWEESSGIQMKIMTSQPGLQCYTSGHMDADKKGKNNVRYQKFSGICLEGQHFPDSPNNEHFPSTILDTGEKYHEVYQMIFTRLLD